MRREIRLGIVLVIMLLATSMVQAADEYKFFYGINWRGNACDNVDFAKNTGYKYLMYQANMENCPNAKDLNFYFEGPDYPSLSYDIYASLNGDTHSSAQATEMSSLFAVKSNEAFPKNLAPGWFTSTNTFKPVSDFQQQKVIDRVVRDSLTKVRDRENRANNFLFAGYSWDVPTLQQDFWTNYQSAGGKQVKVSFWTNIDSTLLHTGITHEYATVSDGRAAYYKKLRSETKKEYPQMKIIMEPWNLYNSWVQEILGRTDYSEIKPDVLCQESPGTDFVDDSRLISAGHSYSQLCSTTPDVYSHNENLDLMGSAAVKGSLFGWYGRFGGTGDMPDYQSILDVPPRLKLIRLIAGWENINNVPMQDRHFDSAALVYDSPKSHADKKVMYSTHPRNGKLYAVVLDKTAGIDLKGKVPAAIYRATSLFYQESDANSSFTFQSGKLYLKSDSDLGKTFIIELGNALPADTAKPAITIIAPVNKSVVSGTITITANGADNVGIIGVQFKLDGNNIAAEEMVLPYSITWNTSAIANGVHTLTAFARDAAGNTQLSKPISITINNPVPDTTKPAITITAPVNNLNAAGIVNIGATATDNVAVTGVQFKLDGANIGSEDASSPYGMVLNSSLINNGAHSITAVARDAAGNTQTSAPVVINVNNIAPDAIPPGRSAGSPSGDLPTTTVTTNIGLSTDETATCKYSVNQNILYSAMSNTFTSTGGTTHSTTVNGLSKGQTYNYYVRCQDQKGNANTNDYMITFRVLGDTTLPTVTITSPANGATVSGVINILATASDNIDIAGVQFRIDGVNFGAEDLTSPRSISWNTSTKANGVHTLTAVARDNSGNTGSTSIIINVNNPVTQTPSPPPPTSTPPPAASSGGGGGGGGSGIPSQETTEDDETELSTPEEVTEEPVQPPMEIELGAAEEPEDNTIVGPPTNAGSASVRRSKACPECEEEVTGMEETRLQEGPSRFAEGESELVEQDNKATGLAVKQTRDNWNPAFFSAVGLVIIASLIISAVISKRREMEQEPEVAPIQTFLQLSEYYPQHAENLVNFINTSRRSGLDDNTIIQSLINVGWPAQIVDSTLFWQRQQGTQFVERSMSIQLENRQASSLITEIDWVN